MTTRKRLENGSLVRLGWQDLVKVVVPIVVTVLSVAVGLYVKVEVSTAVTSARLTALEEAIKRMPSGEQVEAFRIVVNAELASMRGRLDRLEAHRVAR